MTTMTKLAAAGAGLALIAGAVVATPAAAAPTAAATTAGSTVATDGGACALRPGSLWTRLPADLRRDLRGAREASPGDDRRAAFAAIRDAALAGEYGDVAQRVARAHPGLGAGRWRDAPEELKDDVRAALVLSGDARRDALTAIGEAAAAGEYGAEVQARAEQVRSAPWWQDCAG